MSADKPWSGASLTWVPGLATPGPVIRLKIAHCRLSDRSKTQPDELCGNAQVFCGASSKIKRLTRNCIQFI
jgi:hypothetical protein